MNNNNEVISKLADAAIAGNDELERLREKGKKLHQELLLVYVQTRVIKAYLGHDTNKNLFACGERIQIGDDKIYISSEDIAFLRPLPYVKVENYKPVSIEFLKKSN